MKSQYITVRELPEYLKSKDFQSGPVIPISRQRAMAQASNPRALPDDVALILLKEDSRLMGYIGCLPDTIFLQNQAAHLAWMTCIWVSPDARGKGVASRLLKEAFEKWNNRLLATEFTAPAKRLYDKLNLFDDLTVLHGLRAYLRLNLAVLLPKKNPKYAKISPLLKFGDLVFNLFNSIRLSFYKKNRTDFKIEKIAAIDPDTWNWIAPFQQEELFKRSKDELNWLLKNPWLSDDQEALEDSLRYHFSVYDKNFRFEAIKVLSEGKIIGFMILAVRGDSLKIPYTYFESQHRESIAKAITDFMLENNCSILTLYNTQLVEYFQKNKSPFFMIRPFNRHYLIAKALNWPQQKMIAVVQDGDGDCAFT